MFFLFFFYEFVLVSSCQVAMQVSVMASRHSWRHPLLTMCLFPFDILFLDTFFLIWHWFFFLIWHIVFGCFFLDYVYCFFISWFDILFLDTFSWFGILLLLFLIWHIVFGDFLFFLIWRIVYLWCTAGFGNFIFLGFYQILTYRCRVIC